MEKKNIDKIKNYYGVEYSDYKRGIKVFVKDKPIAKMFLNNLLGDVILSFGHSDVNDKNIKEYLETGKVLKINAIEFLKLYIDDEKINEDFLFFHINGYDKRCDEYFSNLLKKHNCLKVINHKEITENDFIEIIDEKLREQIYKGLGMQFISRKIRVGKYKGKYAVMDIVSDEEDYCITIYAFSQMPTFEDIKIVTDIEAFKTDVAFGRNNIYKEQNGNITHMLDLNIKSRNDIDDLNQRFDYINF